MRNYFLNWLTKLLQYYITRKKNNWIVKIILIKTNESNVKKLLEQYRNEFSQCIKMDINGLNLSG
jgi:hypothetical protein